MSCMDCIPKGNCAFLVWKSEVEYPHFVLKSQVVLDAEVLFSLFLIPHPHVSLLLAACNHLLFTLLPESEDLQDIGSYTQPVLFRKHLFCDDSHCKPVYS